MFNMSLYLIVSTIMFALLAYMWRKNDFFNFSIKFVFILLTFLGIFHTFAHYGFVVKI